MSAPQAKDANFPVRFVSSLKGDLLVGSMTGKEQMGRLFVYQLELLSPNYELQFDDVVGQQVTVVLVVANGERYFNGFITEFVFAGISDRFARYQATIRPWFWFLTRTADCQIFQNMGVPDIIKKVFRDNGMKDFKENLSGTYRKFDYCVQYRESDFNFISRLMEQEGIYYFFKHEADKHILVMADNVSAHQPFPEYNKISFRDEGTGILAGKDDHLDAWTTRQIIMPDRYAVQDFNFEAPNVPLLKKAQDDSTHAYPLGDSEIFDYPGEYPGPADGENYVEIRLQELKCQKDTIQAGGLCRGMSTGCWFTFEDYPREDQNGDYLVTSVSHHIDNASFVSGEGHPEQVYRCQIGVIKKLTRFRSARKTPKPMVQGPQTAIVVGPSGEEIHTDKYGRVIVQFHWDRYGNKDQNSSCWVRVSQVWAGAKWGGIHIPRIGQEVIVSFMEGDPDQPIITGRVYNADCMPPYTLEANKTQSGIKSRSTKEGGPDNFNEFRMEDKIGAEEIYIHAEKDQNNVVENDETTQVGHDRTENVGNDENITIGADRTEDVEKNETISIGVDRTESVGKNEVISIGEDQTISIGSNQSEDVGKVLTLSVGGKRITNIAKDDTLEVGKKLTVNVADQITFQTGAASILMKKNGSITIKGKDIKIQGSGKIDVKASKNITLKGSKVLQN